MTTLVLKRSPMGYVFVYTSIICCFGGEREKGRGAGIALYQTTGLPHYGKELLTGRPVIALLWEVMSQRQNEKNRLETNSTHAFIFPGFLHVFIEVNFNRKSGRPRVYYYMYIS